jgi:hypothetical protein
MRPAKANRASRSRQQMQSTRQQKQSNNTRKLRSTVNAQTRDIVESASSQDTKPSREVAALTQTWTPKELYPGSDAPRYSPMELKGKRNAGCIIQSRSSASREWLRQTFETLMSARTVNEEGGSEPTYKCIEDDKEWEKRLGDSDFIYLPWVFGGHENTDDTHTLIACKPDSTQELKKKYNERFYPTSDISLAPQTNHAVHDGNGEDQGGDGAADLDCELSRHTVPCCANIQTLGIDDPSSDRCSLFGESNCSCCHDQNGKSDLASPGVGETATQLILPSNRSQIGQPGPLAKDIPHDDTDYDSDDFAYQLKAEMDRQLNGADRSDDRTGPTDSFGDRQAPHPDAELEDDSEEE